MPLPIPLFGRFLRCLLPGRNGSASAARLFAPARVPRRGSWAPCSWILRAPLLPALSAGSRAGAAALSLGAGERRPLGGRAAAPPRGRRGRPLSGRPAAPSQLGRAPPLGQASDSHGFAGARRRRRQLRFPPPLALRCLTGLCCGR